MDGEGGRLEGRRVGVWRAAPSARAKASWGEESRQPLLTANVDVEASRPGRGRLGLRWGGAGRRAESLTCPDRGWLEVPSPGPGRGQDRMEKHSSLPILPAATPTLSAHHCLLP